MDKIMDKFNSGQRVQQQPPVDRISIQLLYLHSYSQSFSNPAMDGNGEVANIFTDDAREGGEKWKYEVQEKSCL